MKDENRVFYSKSAGCAIHLVIKDSKGRPTKRKRAKFAGGKYYAKTASESELNADEIDLLKANNKFGVVFYDRESWIKLATNSLDKSQSSVVKSAIKERDSEIERLKAELAKSNSLTKKNTVKEPVKAEKKENKKE